MDCILLEHIPEASEFTPYFEKYIHANKVHVCISYASDFKNAKVLREVVDYLCCQFGISPKWRTRLVLISDELNNNAIEYGSDANDTNSFSISLEKLPDKSINILFSVTDSGKWKQAKTSKQMKEIQKKYSQKDFSHHNSIRGRGLFLIISQLVDSIHFGDQVPHGLRVEIEKHLQESQ